MKILIVEDDAYSLKLIVSILEKNSFEVELMKSARDALNFLKKGEVVDLIISDIMMPEIDGFKFVRLLNIDKRLSKIPVILCTALTNKASIVKAIEIGVAGYLIQPIKEAALIAKVKKVLENRPGAILVVDDEELVRNLLVTSLKRDGYRVLTAESGGTAINLLKNNKVSLVMSDIAMPGMDGFDLLVHVKEVDMALPVILMSGRGQYKRDEILALGANDFISKPFYNTEILARVRVHYK